MAKKILGLEPNKTRACEVKTSKATSTMHHIDWYTHYVGSVFCTQQFNIIMIYVILFAWFNNPQVNRLGNNLLCDDITQ